MASRFTLGIEEEFQMVDRNTGQLAPYVHTILKKATPLFGDNIKAEALQSFIEINTAPSSDVMALRLDLYQKTEQLTRLLAEDDITLIRAGTHPLALWSEQSLTQHDRYLLLMDEYQDVMRSILIFGLHIHIGLEDRALAVPLMNQLRTWLPHLLALSANSPFWQGRNSGLKSYRSIVWKRFPRSGVPPAFASTSEYDRYVADLIEMGCIDNAKRIWWDIRPHPFFNTIEFRIFDMPASAEDSIRLAALCQALVAKLSRLHRRNLQTPVLPSAYIEENKWRAARYGLDAQYLDFTQRRSLKMRDAVHELLDFVDDVVDDLQCRLEINALREQIEQSDATGADQQLRVYREQGNAYAVTRYLMEQMTQQLMLKPTML